MMRRLSAWLVVVLAIAGIAAALSRYKYNEIKAAQAAAENSPQPMQAVVTARAHIGEWTATTSAIGTAVARRQLELKNEVAGTITKLGFTSGDVVEPGQVLVQLNDDQEQALLAAAKAEARLAELTLERRAALKNSTAFSAQEFDKSTADFNAATARTKNLAAAIDKKRIVAPFKARVGITNLQPGAYLDVGTLIVRLQGVDTDAFIDFSLPQESALMMKAGATVELKGLNIPNGSATAAIVAEDDSIDTGNRTIRFRAMASGLGTSLRPGAYVDVIAVTAPPQKAVFVPVSAIRRSPEGQHVFLIVEEEGKKRARQRIVETGAVHGDEIVVTKGVAEGDIVASAGSFKLSDGAALVSEAPAASAASKVD